DARLNEAGRKLDVLFFNACLMANFEIAAMMAPFANFMVASADQLWVLTFYERILARLGSNGRDMAAGITDDYNAALQAVIPDVYRTMVALDLSRVGAVNTALNALADALRTNQTALLEELKKVRQDVQVYDSSGNNLLDQVIDNTGALTNREDDAFVDLAHLANLLSQNTTLPTAVRQAASNLTTALNSIIVKSLLRSGSNDEGARHDYVAAARGLAIYFPNGNNFGDQPTYNDLYLNRSHLQPFRNTSQWDEFVRGYINGVIGRGPGSVGRAPGSVGRAGRPVSGQGIPFQGRVYLPLTRR
ncbi:MAG: clostripain-related cysteine peptidase, partial [Oscillochloridaceae bacterium umkhey_bin13]